MRQDLKKPCPFLYSYLFLKMISCLPGPLETIVIGYPISFSRETL